ncbi:MAG: cytochrome c family protein [Aestuariivirga sp.]
MDSFEWNKIIGAVLGTGLLVFGLKIVGSGLFAGEAPEKAGYAIAATSAQTADAGAAAAGPKETLGALLAKADKSKGETETKACGACHDFTKGGPDKIGPHLYGVVGRPMGSVEGFPYSDGFKAMGSKPWDYAELDHWLSSPKDMAKGTKMVFSGIHDDQKRADVLAYLGSLSDAPVAFPAP